LCDGGDLRKAMNKRNGQPYPESEARRIFADMLLGMKTIVDHGYVHRDLKPENTFITKGKYQIADFGFCQIVKPGQQMDFFGGTPGYMNPQIVLQQKYTHKCDIWTIAIIYYELLFGNIPGRGRDDQQRIADLSRNGVQFPRNIRISDESRAFLQGCL
jgi:serine/threonine protein kinase